MFWLSAVLICSSALLTNGFSDSTECLDFRETDVEKGGKGDCNCTLTLFRLQLSTQSLKLTSLLEKLKAWNCHQFHEECEKRSFNYNRFTFLVYERFCNLSNFDKICNQEMELSFRNTNETKLNVDIEKTLNSNSIVVSPCLQVSSYKYGKPFYEINSLFSAYCDPVWCGFDEVMAESQLPSLWACFPNKCLANVLITMVVCGLLAFSIVVANLTIIVVILQHSRFPTCQLIYKLSLAFADILVGIFVVPSFVLLLNQVYFSSYEKVSPMSAGESKNSSLSAKATDQDPNSYYHPSIDLAYFHFVGSITFFSLFNSVFTLMFASYDRFRSLSNPLGYDREKATYCAKYVTGLLWLVSFTLALLPAVVPAISDYAVISRGIMILPFNEATIFIIGIVLAFPFLMMWIFTIGVLFNLKRPQTTRENDLSGNETHFLTERKLSITVSFMIAIFTACVLPSTSILLVSEFQPEVRPQNSKFDLQSANSYGAIELAVSIIFSSNSLWNAFIYSIKNKQFRKDATSLYYKTARALGFLDLKNFISNSISSET